MTIVDGVRLVSNSEVTTFQDCPRKWWLAWYRGLTPKAVSETGALATGTRIHEALASYYVPEGETPVNPLETLEKLHQDVLAKAVVNALLDPEEDAQVFDYSKVFDLEKAMISGYIQWLEETGADQHLEVIASEKYVEVELDDIRVRGTVMLIGKLDALVRHLLTGYLLFLDHKTVGTFSIPNLRQNPQMLHYELIKMLRGGDDNPTPDGALYNMLRKVKRTRASSPPYYERRVVPHNRHELDAHLNRVVYVIQQMENAEDRLDMGWHHHEAVPARPSNDCHWKCQFFKICPMFDDGSRVEAKIEDFYDVKDPLHYYGGKELAG